jgi:hypothetical protein
VYIQSQNANTHIQKGDDFINQNDPESALKEYQLAKDELSLISLTQAYKERVKHATGLLETEETVPSVVIFLEDNTPQKTITAFIKQLELVSGFSTVKLLSKEEALKSYEKRVEGVKAEELFSYISADDLFLTIEVYLSDKNVTSQIISLAQSKNFVYQVFEVGSENGI